MNMNKGSATEEEILSEAKDDRAAAQPITRATEEEVLRFAQDDSEPRMTGLERRASPERMGLHLFLFIIGSRNVRFL